jgi:Kef-type K+ transport system membrane component KefB
MAGGDFTPVLEIVLFCVCLFVAGVLCKRIGFSPIIGEMAVGVALGPNGVDLVPYEQFFRLAGVFGVTLMIFESGLHVDFVMLRKVGLRASVVAVLGTFLPLLSGMFLMVAFDPDRYSIWPVGLAAGVTLAPTSVGMALKMLGEKKQLGEEYGQLIVTVRRRTLRPDRAR